MSNLEVDDEDEMSLLRGKRFGIRYIARQESEMPKMQGNLYSDGDTGAVSGPRIPP